MPEYLYSDKCTNANISYITYDAISYESKDEVGKLVRGLDGAPIRRTIKLVNRLIAFSYAISSEDVESATKLIGTVNRNPICIGGIPFEAKKVKLISFASEPIKSDESAPCTGVNIILEVGDQHSVYESIVPREGFLFKHPKKGNMVRIQYSSEPSIYLEDKVNFPNAINVWKGFGFYTESRPDLNVLEPFPLNEDGSLNTGDVIEYIKTVDASVGNWSLLGIPEKGLV